MSQHFLNSPDLAEMHIYTPDICCINSVLVFASRGQLSGKRWEAAFSVREEEEFYWPAIPFIALWTLHRRNLNEVCCAAPPFTGKVQTLRSHLISFLYGYPGTANLWLLVIASCKPSWHLTTSAIQMLLSGKLGHKQTSTTVRAAWYQTHTNLIIIILSQQLLLLDVQHASGEYKTTILSLLLATRALRYLRNQQFHPGYGYQASQSHTHFQIGFIFHTWRLLAHRGAACWPTQSLIPWKCLEIMYDRVSSPLEKEGTQQNIWEWDTQPARL